MLPDTWHSGKDKTTETVKRRLVARGWGKNKQSTESLKGVKILCIMPWWTHVIIHLFRSTECMIAPLNVSCGLYVMIMCQCKFINYDEWITLVGDILIMREDRRYMGNFHSFLSICYAPKTTLKKSSKEIKVQCISQYN